jgi:hypothetical protein
MYENIIELLKIRIDNLNISNDEFSENIKKIFNIYNSIITNCVKKNNS